MSQYDIRTVVTPPVMPPKLKPAAPVPFSIDDMLADARAIARRQGARVGGVPKSMKERSLGAQHTRDMVKETVLAYLRKHKSGTFPELAGVCNMEPSNFSNHIAKMRAAGVVDMPLRSVYTLPEKSLAPKPGEA